MVVSRFPPSPTGDLHIGGARTALYAWLYAKKYQGEFVLRIEDTDRERSTESSVQAILDGMAWLGLNYDKGPYYQTQRMDRYTEIINRLLEQGDAYYCQCSREELDALREQQRASKEKPMYNRKCRHAELTVGAERVVRFKNPEQGSVVFEDAVKGQIEINNAELDDLIIARADGTPTYNLTVVVDDMDMGITHVIRGDDHINNTPRQINIMHALAHSPPIYAHVPMILGDDGKRLSKRHGAVSVMQYRDEGYLPHAVLNYLIRLGWSHGEQEIFSIEEMIDYFELNGINQAASTFNTEKLNWVNQQHIQQMSASELMPHLEWFMAKAGLKQHDLENGPAFEHVIELLKPRAVKLGDFIDQSAYFYHSVDGYEEGAQKKHFKTATGHILTVARTHLQALQQWTPETIDEAIAAVCEALALKMVKVGPPIRVAVTGTAMSPSLDATLALIGQQRSLERLDNAIAFIEKKYADA